MERIVIVGDDKFGNTALKELKHGNQYKCYVDKSTNLKRLLKLIRKRRLSLTLILKMTFCEACRSGQKPSRDIPSIKTNRELVELIQDKKPDEVILFRAGLIINSEVLAQNCKIINIHCAKIPEYGGIGSIARALRDKHYTQQATLHIVTEEIDKGEVLNTIPYRLDPSLSYCMNEKCAYQAGIALLKKHLCISP